MVVRIRLFGTVEVSTPSRTFGVKDFPSRKAKQLCELLALEQGRWVHRDRLIEELWGDKLPQNPSAALDHTASLLRRLLRADDGSQCLITGDASYRIDTTAAVVDVVRFDQLAQLGANADGVAALQLLVEAATLVDGELVADEPYAPWAAAARAHYRQRVENMLVDVARRALALDDPELARKMAERARLASPEVIEEAYALNISALAALGRLDDARRLMGELERRLGVEFDSEISGDTVLLRSLLRQPAMVRGAHHVAVTVKTEIVDEVMDLPCVGRDAAIASIMALLSRNDGDSQSVERSPVVIEGPAGIGKSHLLDRVVAQFESGHRIRCLETDREQPLFVATRLVAQVDDAGPHPQHDVDQGPGTPMVSAATLFSQFLRIDGRPTDTVLAIDDLQWADVDSIAMIAGLAQHGVKVVATRRAGESVEMPSARPEKIVLLGPLDRGDVDRLPMRGAWDETGGHPGMLQLCLRQRSSVPLDDDAIGCVLGWIGPETSAVRAVLAAASTIRPCSIEQLAGRLGLSTTITLSIIDQARQLHLVELTADGAVTFRGDLMRRVLQSVGVR